MYSAAIKKIAIGFTFVIGMGVGLSGCGDDTASAAKQQKQAAQYYERAENYLRQGQYRAAIIEARNALKLAPDDVRNSALLARTLNEIGQPKQTMLILEPLAQTVDAGGAAVLTEAYLAQRKNQTALDYLESQNARLNVDRNPELQLLKARALSGIGNFDAAKTLQQTLQKNPQFATRATLESARDMAAQGDGAGALTLAKQILQKDPKHVPTLLFAARLAEQGADLALAEDLLGRALIELPQSDILAPTKIAVLETLSSVVTKLGRSNEALVYTKALADADPERMHLQEKFNRGLELFQSGKLAEAEPLLTEVYQQSQNDTAGILLGMIKYANNDLPGATQYFTAHIDPESSPDQALLALAATDLRSAQPEKLLQTFGPEQRARLKNPQLQALVGIALLETGKTDEGERLVAQARAAQPDNVAITTILARHYLLTHQATPAIELLRQTLSTHPQDSGVNQLLIGAYLEAGDKTRALEVARAYAAQKPAKAENFAVLGHTALVTRQLDSAAEALQKALALEPKLSSAQFDLAQLYLLQKRADKAEPLFLALLQTDANNIIASKGLITARELANGRDATADTIEQWMPGIKTSATARTVVAEYFVRNGRMVDAERLLQASTDAPNQRYSSYVRQLLALARADQAAAKQDFAGARNELVQALRLEPRSVPLLNQLARLELRANAPQEAEKIVAQLEQLQPQTASVEELKADIAAAQQRWPDAIARYRTLWQRQPLDNIGAKLYRCLQATDRNAATQLLTEWQTKLPTSATPLLLQGMAAEQQGDQGAAVLAYETGVARDGNNATALNNLALLYLQKGDSRARELAAKAHQLQPRNPAVLDTYGWILLKNKEPAKALKLLREAAVLAPQEQDIKDHLKEAERESGSKL